DFRSFSQAHQKELQAMLNEWQKIDGFLNFQWIRGLSGKSQLPAGEMIKRMDDVFEHFKKSPTPIWIMAQIKGITAHAFLVLDMLESGPGYKLEVIDSNHPGDTLVLEYQHGDTALKAPK